MPVSARSLLDRLPAARAPPRTERGRALRLLAVEHLRAGERIYDQDEPPEQMALVLSGSLLVSAQMSDGSTLPLGRVRPGEVIGEMGLLDHAPRSARVTCEVDSVLLVLDRDSYGRLLEEGDPVLIWLLELAARGMAKRIGAMSERIAAVAMDAEQLERFPVSSHDRPRRLWDWLGGSMRRP